MSDRIKPPQIGRFRWEVEEVIVDLLQGTGALELEGDDIMANAGALGYRIVRKKVKKREELITLLKNEEIVKTIWVKQEKGSILKMELSKEDMIEEMKRRGM